jgi:hypothetical protein
MAFLSSFYPQPVVAGTTAGTYAEGNDSRIVGALPSSTAGSGSVLASGSTTSRSLANRFSETVKVADFGAVGDGVTDDTDAIQDAIDYAISLGGAIIEFEHKTYNLIASKANSGGTTWPLVINRNHLEIHGGTSSMKLIFKGNGAKIYTNVMTSGAISYIFAITTDFKSIEFHDFTFERGPTTTPSAQFQSGLATFAMRPVSTNFSDNFTCKNVTFVNAFSAIIDNRGFSVSKTYKKLRRVEWLQCSHLHTRGSNTSDISGGGQMINLSGWVDHFNADGVYVDGAVGGTIPNDVTYPVDGWLYVNPYNTHITNSTFKNMWVEGLFFEQPPNTMINIGSFTQPAVGSTVTVTVKSEQLNWNEQLIAGKLYTIRDTDLGAITTQYKPWATGVYKAISWDSPIQANSTITFERVSDELILRPDSASPSLGQFLATGATTSNNCAIILHEEGGIAAGSITNCHFYQDAPITRANGTSRLFRINVTNGGSNYTSPPNVLIEGGGSTAVASISNGVVTGINVTSAGYYTQAPNITISGGGGSNATATSELFDFRMAPCIKASTAVVISNCTFRNFSKAISINPFSSVGYSGPTIINNCIFYGEGNKIVGSFSPFDMVDVVAADSIIANNVFIQDVAESFKAAISCGRAGININNNNFRLQKPADNGDGISAIYILNSENNAEWQMHINNNNFYGYNHAIKGNVPTVMGAIFGEFVDAPISISGGTVRGTTTRWITPNGNLWTLGVTNDGELQISN